jgi:hypothetical protein
MVSKKTCAVAAVVVSALTAGQAIASENFKQRIYDSAKHTRIYFPGGVSSFADEVVEYKVGKKKTPHLWETGEPALGTPNFKDHEADRLARNPTFAGLGGGGSITLRFVNNAIVDGPGGDIYIFEPLENSSPVKVEVSRDGKTWLDLGPDLTTASEIDIAGKGGKNAVYSFIRISDESKVDPADQWPGADIDAVGALNSATKITVLDHDLCRIDPLAKKKSPEPGESKAAVSEIFKNVPETYIAEMPAKLVVDVYSDTHESKEHHGAEQASAPGPTSDTKNPEAKARTGAVREYLLGAGKIPKQHLVVEYFDDARSMARRDVVKEHERDNRFEFIFVPYDRDTVVGDKGSLKIDHAAKLLDGKWDSDLGEMILMTWQDPATKKVSVQGEWHESPARKGVIQSGTFDPKTNMLNVAFYRTWSNVRGNAEFKLSFDSARLKGTWKGEVNGNGDWVLMRKN